MATSLLMVAVLIVEVKVKDFLYSHFLSYGDRLPPTSDQQFLWLNSFTSISKKCKRGCFLPIIVSHFSWQFLVIARHYLVGRFFSRWGHAPLLVVSPYCTPTPTPFVVVLYHSQTSFIRASYRWFLHIWRRRSHGWLARGR